MYIKFIWAFLCIGALLVSTAANSVTIDFDSLTSGSSVFDTSSGESYQ